MTGELLKSRLLKIEPVMAKLARKLDMSPQALNQTLGAADIKTGFIERLSAMLGKPICYFFGDDISTSDFSHSSVHGNTEHNNGVDSIAYTQLQIAEERIKFLESQLKDKHDIICEKDARIAELTKMNNYIMEHK